MGNGLAEKKRDTRSIGKEIGCVRGERGLQRVGEGRKGG